MQSSVWIIFDSTVFSSPSFSITLPHNWSLNRSSVENTPASEKEQVIKNIGGKLLCLWKEVYSLHTPVCLFPEPPNWSMLSLLWWEMLPIFRPPFQGGSDVLYFETSIEFSFLRSQGCINDNKEGQSLFWQPFFMTQMMRLNQFSLWTTVWCL